MLWELQGESVVPGFRLQEHGGPWIKAGLQEGYWGPCGMQRGLVEDLAMLGFQGGTLGALGVKRSQGGHRGGHFVLQGCRRPCWWCKERLGVLEHFTGREEGALGVHNHRRGGGKEGSWALG